jgi:hypothetical protein
MFAGSSWQISIRGRGEVGARVVELVHAESHDPTIGDVIDVKLPDGSIVRAKITHFAELPPLDGSLGTVRFEVMTEEI